MADRVQTGVLDTSAYIDLGVLNPVELPHLPLLTAVTLVELQQGVAMARTPADRAARSEALLAATSDFDPLPLDGSAAARYGTLVALTLAVGRDPGPRRLDLMIAAIASCRGLPLFTRNAGDLRGLADALTVVAL